MRDENNITYSHTVSSVYNSDGTVKEFHKQKYLPKIRFLEKHYGDKFNAITILDVGVGYGAFVSFLEEYVNYENLFGMDPFEKSIEIAQNFTSATIKKGQIENENWPFPENFFDVITCFDVLEHLWKPKLFFITAKRYLKPNGIVLISTPNKQLPYLLRSMPVIGIPDGNPTHINVRKPSYWKRLAICNNWDIIQSWKGEHLTHIKYIPQILCKACRINSLDHRKVPVINAFEQSFCLVLQYRKG